MFPFVFRPPAHTTPTNMTWGRADDIEVPIGGHGLLTPLAPPIKTDAACCTAAPDNRCFEELTIDAPNLGEGLVLGELALDEGHELPIGGADVQEGRFSRWRCVVPPTLQALAQLLLELVLLLPACLVPRESANRG